MPKEEKSVLAFYDFTKRWPEQRDADRPQEFMVGLYYKSGGCDCEIKLHLQTWTNSTGLAWHLGIYNDAWAYLPKFQPFLNALSEAQAALDSKNETWERNKCLTTEQIYDIFKACKVKDFTFLERG